MNLNEIWQSKCLLMLMQWHAHPKSASTADKFSPKKCNTITWCDAECGEWNLCACSCHSHLIADAETTIEKYSFVMDNRAREREWIAEIPFAASVLIEYIFCVGNRHLLFLLPAQKFHSFTFSAQIDFCVECINAEPRFTDSVPAFMNLRFFPPYSNAMRWTIIYLLVLIVNPDEKKIAFRCRVSNA